MKTKFGDVWICPICSTSNRAETSRCFVCDHLLDVPGITSRKKVDGEVLEDCFQDALLYMRREEYDDAKQKLMFAAEHGHTKAIVRLAECCLSGELPSLEIDETSAYKWFLTAARSGSAKAQLEVGKCYLKGIGTRKNRAHASTWIAKAVKQGYPPAVFYYADMLISGEEIRRDVKKGLAMYDEQGRNGNTDAWYLLGLKYSLGDGLAQSDRRAARFFKKAARSGNVRAMVKLATCYETGTGVFASRRKALHWLELAEKSLEDSSGR